MPAATRDELDATPISCWYRRITPSFAADVERESLRNNGEAMRKRTNGTAVRQQLLVMLCASWLMSRAN